VQIEVSLKLYSHRHSLRVSRRTSAVCVSACSRRIRVSTQVLLICRPLSTYSTHKRAAAWLIQSRGFHFTQPDKPCPRLRPFPGFGLQAYKPCPRLRPVTGFVLDSGLAKVLRDWLRLFTGLVAYGQNPVGTHEVACISVRESLQIVLMLWLGFPEISRRRNFSNDLAWPNS
jgi:hypothetical protein